MSHRVTTHVPCAEYFPVRDAALIAHATQIDPNGRWFACPIEVQQRVWPTEDYELARSLVGTVPPADPSTGNGRPRDAVIEDDLFAGVRSEVAVP
jgi:mycothiol S-conjugate amidase